jgi:aminoglycoside 6-adenylyltransferase
LIDRVCSWASVRDDVHAVLLVGSAVRAPDTWGDVDLLVLTDDVEGVLEDSSPAFADAVIMFVERPPGAFPQRRLAFADGTDVDLVAVPAESLLREPSDTVRELVYRGARVLYDRDGALACVVESAAGWEPPTAPPTAHEVGEAANEFWFKAIWAAKKLGRGELWRALECCNGDLKRLLLLALEWEARARRVDHWYGGRFVERWGDVAAVSGLRGTFAHYDEDDVRRALAATMDLYEKLCADLDGYPREAERFARAQVERVLAG